MTNLRMQIQRMKHFLNGKMLILTFWELAIKALEKWRNKHLDKLQKSSKKNFNDIKEKDFPENSNIIKGVSIQQVYGKR